MDAQSFQNVMGVEGLTINKTTRKKAFDIDELLLMLVNMAEEPCESYKDFRELVRKNAQVAYTYNKRNR